MKLSLFFLLGFLTSLAYGHETISDVVYDEINGVKLELDVFTPSKFSLWPRPALVFIHGGCFSAGSRKDIPEEMKKLADEGIVVFSVSYRLSTVAKYPAALKDLQQAIRFIRRNSLRYRINPRKIIVHGESAGGTLAAYLGVRPITNREGKIDILSQRVPYVSEWYGRTDFTAGQATGTDCAERFLGMKRGPETMEAFKKASILPSLDEKSAEFFIIHGTNDQQVYSNHSTLLANKLWSLGKKAELYFNENQGHAFDRKIPWILTKNRILSFAGVEQNSPAHPPFYELEFSLYERREPKEKFDLDLIFGIGPKAIVLSQIGSEEFNAQRSIEGKIGIISKSQKHHLRLQNESIDLSWQNHREP